MSVQAMAQQVSVAPYYGGRLAALSLTFDDGLQDQYTLAFPELKRRGLKGTFAIIGSKVGGMMRSKQDRQDGTDGTPTMTWDQLREMAADGQEIASHGWEHRPVTRLDAEALRLEVARNDSAILANIGQRPMTYVYPGNNKSAETVRFCEQDRTGSRRQQTSVGSKRTTAYLKNYVDELIAKGQWGVTMTHGIVRGYDHFQDPQVLWDFLDDICGRQELLWIAPHRDVAAYVRERDDVRLTVTPTADGYRVKLATTLNPKIFNHPLTLEVHTPLCHATQDGKSLAIKRVKDVAYVDVNPYGGEVMLRK